MEIWENSLNHGSPGHLSILRRIFIFMGSETSLDSGVTRKCSKGDFHIFSQKQQIK